MDRAPHSVNMVSEKTRYRKTLLTKTEREERGGERGGERHRRWVHGD